MVTVYCLLSFTMSSWFHFYLSTTDSFYFHTLLFIIYLSATETLFCRGEMSSIRSTSFGFAQNTIHDFQNDLVVALSSTNATK